MRGFISLWFSLGLVVPNLCLASKPPDLSQQSKVSLLLVPGCPTKPNGLLSRCIWYRAIWAAEIYRQGWANHLVASGGAVYSPYIEATALKTALIARGVPQDAITVETQARHTDENIAYSLALFKMHPPTTFGVASHSQHARLACRLARSWGTKCQIFAAPEDWVQAEIGKKPPPIQFEAIPDKHWVQHEEDEHDLRRDRRKGPWANRRVYFRYLLWGRLLGWGPPAVPGPEPTAQSNESK